MKDAMKAKLAIESLNELIVALDEQLAENKAVVASLKEFVAGIVAAGKPMKKKSARKTRTPKVNGSDVPPLRQESPAYEQ